ncbi:MAG: hydrogenase maturation protease [Candidatus Methylacidiphilaceae bacterium]
MKPRLDRSRPKPVLIAGLGNPDRGDDGFGPAVLARLAPLRLPHVEMAVCRRPLDLLDLWPDRRLALLVDAALPWKQPGRLTRLEPLLQKMPLAACSSTHSIGLTQAIELALALGMLPGRLVVYAAEAHDSTFGAPLSPPVAAAVEEAVRGIVEELDNSGG